MTGTGSDLSVTPTASALTGSGDTTALEVSGVTAGIFTVSGATETLSIKSSGSATNTLTNVAAASAANLVISGSGTFKTTGNIGANFTLVDARSASAVDIDLVSSSTQTVLLGSGNDTLELNTALATGNLISMGAGTDTLELAVSTGGGAATLTGIENIKVTDGAATDINLANADGPVAVEIAGAATTLSVQNMKAGTTIRATEALAVANASTISFADTAVSTSLNLDLQKGDSNTNGAQTFTNVENLTVTTGAATGFANTVLDETAAGTVVTKSFTLTNTGTGAVGIGDITAGDKVETFTVNNTGTGAVTVGAYIDIEKLKTLTINATAGAVTVGALGGTTPSTDLNSVTVNAGANVRLGAIGSADTAGIATVTLAATGGLISGDGTADGTLGGAATITNAGGNIKAVSISGSKDIEFGLVTTGGSSRVETITSTATGSVFLTVTNAATSGAGSTISLGNAIAGKTNQLTLGSGANDNVTSGSGDDTFILTSDGSDTIDGGAGTDTLSFAGNTNGQIISIDSATNYLNSKTAATAVAADIVTGGRVYDNNSGSVNTTSAGYTMVVSNIENIIGSDAADIIYGNSAANSIQGGAGSDIADTIFGGGGDDTIAGGTGVDVINAGSGANSITDAGSGADVITHDAASSTVAITVTGTGAVTLTASAAGATATVAGTVVGTVNASTSTAAVTLTSTSSGIATFTGGDGADSITGAGAADVLVGGAGNDTITGGAGADAINVGVGTDRVVQAALGASGTFALGSGTTNSVSTATLDVVTGFGAGDVLQLAQYTGTAATSAAANVLVSTIAAKAETVATTSGPTLADNTVVVVRGTHTGGSTNTFVGSSSGADLLVIYDGNAALSTTAYEAVVLVGVGALTTTVTAGAGGLLAFAA